MRHRHLVEGVGLVPAAIDDILEHGSPNDWRELWAEVERDPRGPVSAEILHICAAHEMYGTSRLWPRMIELEREDSDMPRNSRQLVETPEDWERVIEAAVRIQRIVPDAVLVGGTASALHCQHRFSADDDHVVKGLVERYDEIVRRIEAEAGWQTNELTPPVMVLGNFYGVQTGIRNLIRSAPLETTAYETPYGDVILPTLPEMARIKGYLFVRRNATRDLIDFVALTDRLNDIDGPQAVRDALSSLDGLYPQQNGQSIARQLALQLGDPKPYDLGDARLRDYRILDERYASWTDVREKSLELAAQIERDQLRDRGRESSAADDQRRR